MGSFRARVGGIPAEVVRVLVFYLNEDFNKQMFIYKSYRRHKIHQTLFKQSDKEVGRILPGILGFLVQFVGHRGKR